MQHIYNSPFPFSNSEIFTIINATQLRFLKRLVLKHSKLEDFLIESGSEFHAMAALCPKVSLPISDLRLGNSSTVQYAISTI